LPEVGGLFQAVEALTQQYNLIFKGVPTIPLQKVQYLRAAKTKLVQAFRDLNIKFYI